MIPIAYFRALSDRTRLRLVNLLAHQELNVNEIVDILNIAQSRVSHHLKILTESGLLNSRRDGLWAFYSGAKSGPARKFIDSIQFLFKGEKEMADDLARSRAILWQRQEETAGFFDAVAGNWDRMQREVIGDVDLTGEIMKRVKKCRVVADLGCGSGRFLTALQGMADTVIGVDKSPKMLKEAGRHLLRTRAKGDFDLRIGEVEHLPMADAEADVALINFVLHHLPSPDKGIAEAFRVLKKDGIFIVVDFAKHKNETMRKKYRDRWLGFSRPELEKWLTEAGFELDSMTEFDLLQGLKSLLCVSIKK